MATDNRLIPLPMANEQAAIQVLLDVLDEPALIVRGGAILRANVAAKALLGPNIEGADVRLAIRNPKALAHIQPGKNANVEVTGIGGFGRSWLLSVRALGQSRILVRFSDRSAAVAAERMRVDFVANASHELRTPLTAIVGYAETMADDELEPATRIEFATTIGREARRMLRIIEDLMGLSRIEADRFVMPRDSVAIGEVVTSAAEQLRATAIAAGSDFDITLAPELPTILGDRAQLSQLCDNLLSNAVRYGRGPDGEPVRVEVVSIDGTVRLTIADSGPGIAPEHLPRLTERFYRIDDARSRETGGTGLGLAIVKHIVERHRGTLDIRSAPGMGTTVTVTLPVSRPGQ